MPEKFRFFKKKDFLFIIAVLITALGIRAFAATVPDEKQKKLADVYYNGSLIKTVNLDKPAVFCAEPLPRVVFEVRDDSIAFIGSDCPDQVCVHTGRLDRPGQFAACLPNRIALHVRAAQGGYGEPDIIAK